MGVNLSKRFVAFVIDLIIISCITSVISFIVPQSENAKKLNEELTTVSTDYVNGDIKEDEYINKIAPITYRLDKENFIFSIIGTVISILYFIVFAFIKNGQTLGKKVMGIKVIKHKGDLTINDMIFRSFIINSLLFDLILLVLLFTTKDVAYLYSITILSYIQLGLIFVSALMVLIRKDNLALHDIITKTKVVEVK